jgi:hypothetical protein
LTGDDALAAALSSANGDGPLQPSLFDRRAERERSSAAARASREALSTRVDQHRRNGWWPRLERRIRRRHASWRSSRSDDAGLVRSRPDR